MCIRDRLTLIYPNDPRYHCTQGLHISSLQFLKWAILITLEVQSIWDRHRAQHIQKHIVVFLLKSIAKIECNPCIWLLLISFTVFRSKERKNFFFNNDKEIIWLWGSSSNFSSRSPRHNTYVQQGQQSLNLYTERKKSPGRHQKNYQELTS